MVIVSVEQHKRAKTGQESIQIGTAQFVKIRLLNVEGGQSITSCPDRNIPGYRWIFEIFGLFVERVIKRKVKSIGLSMNTICLCIILFFYLPYKLHVLPNC